MESLGKRKLEKLKRAKRREEKIKEELEKELRIKDEKEKDRLLTETQGGDLFRLREVDLTDTASSRARDEGKRALFFSRAEADKNFKRVNDLLKIATDSDTSLRLNLTDMSDSMKPYLVAALLYADPTRKILLILPDELSMRSFSQDLSELGIAELVQEYRARELEFLSLDAVGRENEFLRLATLRKMEEGKSRLVLATASSISQRIESFENIRNRRISLEIGTVIDRDELQSRLSTLGFERVSVCSEPGQMSIRGEIVDIVPVDDCLYDIELDNEEKKSEDAEKQDENHTSQVGIDKKILEDDSYELVERIDPRNFVFVKDINKRSSVETGIRICFFDDEIERIDRFELNSQRTICNLDSYTIFPQREVLLDSKKFSELEEYLDQKAKSIRKEKIKAGAGLEEADKIAKIYLRDKERVEAKENFPALDRYSSMIFDSEENIVSFATKLGYTIICDEPLRLRQRMDALQAERMQDAENYLERMEAPEEITNAYLSVKDTFNSLTKAERLLSFASLISSGNGFPGAENIKLSGRESESRLGLERQMLDEFLERKKEGYLSFILCSESNRRSKVRELIWKERTELGDITLPINLSRGFDYRAAGLYALGSGELFGQKRQQRRSKKKKGRPITLFTDLRIGELLVHDVYGIGIYKGLSQISQDGITKDFIEIEYADNDKLYIPMDALDQIQKYIGGSDKERVKLSRLGGSEWEKAKTRARDSIRQLATNLISLYAKRKEIKGYSFSKDSPWNRDFADRFEFQETDDQLQAIEEISSDMESDKVMDRLLCGDVGFGKTEVAFRAIFKAASDSKQVAFLAPTTVLSQQHYENFKRRLGDFPIRVALLNRFVTNTERKRILKAIRKGEIDVVIGTHRLLSKDVEFRDLGLLVIDEEQRFGVDHKEGIKERYPEVDVLSLSATPIPRTLHMSLSGIRDISVIEEAPENRRPVRTYVLEYDLALIVEAIMREINRHGQVFYLFNNVKEMDREYSKLKEQLPHARILMAHGQMPEHQLEEVIESFINKEADILICSTIIESGIDMPNVNTLIVTDADRFGLSQLYQIKGRVGRSTRQAYAYFTYKRDKVITEEAEKRLTALKEYTELGSGLKIALRDLEVRGAGNLLGAEQHGQMASIGYDLYCRMLDEEIQYARELERVSEQREANQSEYIENLQDKIKVRKVETRDNFSPKVEALATNSINEASAGAESKDEQMANSSPFSRRQTRAVSLDTLIDLSIDAYISPNYISDDTSRVDVYRRIVKIEDYSDYLDLQDEFIDRFGEPPVALLNLLNVSYVRVRASLLGISRISRKKDMIVMSIDSKKLIRMEEISALMAVKAYEKRLQLDLGSNPCIKFFNCSSDDAEVIDELRKLFYACEKIMLSKNE